MNLTEKYRPRLFGDVVGQPKAIETMTRLSGRFGGRALWVSGPSGAGKTTIARIVAGEVADQSNTVEYDAGDQVTSGELAEMDRMLCIPGMGNKGGRAWIINEAHGMRTQSVRTMLGLLERLPAWAVVIFTTTKEGEDALFEDEIDASPLLSRCIPVRLTNQGLHQAFAERVMGIARAENLDGQPMDAYLKLAKRCKGNCRAMLMEVEAGCMVKGGAL